MSAFCLAPDRWVSATLSLFDSAAEVATWGPWPSAKCYVEHELD